MLGYLHRLGKRTSKINREQGGRSLAWRSAAVDADDLESALKNLGYKAKEVDQLCSDLASDSKDASFEGLLKEALKRLNRNDYGHLFSKTIENELWKIAL